MDPGRPVAQAVAVVGDRISAVGSNAEVLANRGPATRAIDCLGNALIPGINDAHIHFFATATARAALDCGPEHVATIHQLLAAIAGRAADLAPGKWIRGRGLDSKSLLEGRFPSRQELDAVSPLHPVRLDHSSGHACVLNSHGLALASIDHTTPDPPDGVIVRNGATGEPTGLLLEVGAFLRERLKATRDAAEFEADVRRLSADLLSLGVTSVQDAGHTNGPGQWQTFGKLVENGAIKQRVTMMVGAPNVPAFNEMGLGWQSGFDGLRLGHAKIMLTCTTGGLQPAPADLSELAATCLALGFPFAVHAVEQEAVAAVASLPETRRQPKLTAGTTGATGTTVSRELGDSRSINRIEHCSECPPGLLEMVARSGATVVTQPGFIYWRGDNYLERVEGELLPHLYDVEGMRQSKIPVAFSSDAPVIDPSPWPGIYSALCRRTRGGQPLARRETVASQAGAGCEMGAIYQAIAAYTREGAAAEALCPGKGAISPGMLADLAVLDTPLTCGNWEQLLEVRSELTLVGGEILWRSGSL